jgi:hypothetical protein
MGFEEDKIELTGSDYEIKLYDLKMGYAEFIFLINTNGDEWEFSKSRPEAGKGKYIERMPNGECKEHPNQK